jgi:hypothetical protein
MKLLSIVWAVTVSIGVTCSVSTGAPCAADLSEEYLKALTFGDNVPGFRQLGARKGETGPWVVLHRDEDGAARSGYIESLWESADGLSDLRIRVRVRLTPDQAWEDVRARTSTPLSQDPPDDRIGDESRARFSLGAGVVRFAVGRVSVSLLVYPVGRRSPNGEPVISQMDAHVEEVLRMLARGLEWVIRQHPEMMADTEAADRLTVVVSGTPVSAPALTFGGVAWASLDAFRQAGAKVAWDAKSGKATVSYGGKTVELTALRREARVNGKKLDLGAGVMVDRLGPVVPLRKIAEALGMRVRVTRTTIEIG